MNDVFVGIVNFDGNFFSRTRIGILTYYVAIVSGKPYLFEHNYLLVYLDKIFRFLKLFQVACKKCHQKMNRNRLNW